ncbi:hypothetical protein [Pedobacter cryotolerans]|uniref:Uncharacterized protein n=1 Tax=Pedobacter cryotolerans TaxID=2571270 RepID=A0A4U1BX20_9SPHI|nr:hypothetical protein [Pedobacter cryotolerans]TKB97198.1 hypothetical protein FA045_16700 [Pedobacter cryotolerans]
MKKIFIYSALLVSITLTLSCYKEKLIVPSSLEGADRFKFPQGTNDYDLAVKKVYDDFGIKIIYKGFDDKDFGLSWTSPAFGKQGFDIPENQQKDAVNFIANHIFGNLNAKITNKVLPPYFYVADSLSQSSVTGTFQTTTPINYYYTGLDFWAFTWDGVRGETKNLTTGVSTYTTARVRPITSFQYFYKRGVILKEIFKSAVDKGNIVPPENFNSGIDFTTPIVTAAASSSDVNYYKKRGFPGQMTNTLNFNIGIVSLVTNTGPTRNFIDYIHLCMRYKPDSIEVNYPKSQFPIIHQKYPIVIQYMKDKYGIDLDKIATKP